MSIIDWIIVVLFLVALTSIGFIFSKRNKNMEDYFLGGRSMSTWMVALAATGTSISAGTFVGSPELGFNTNLTYLLLCVGAIIGGLAVAALVLPKLYKANTITIYGYIGERFDEHSKRTTSAIFLLGQLFTSGSRLFIAAIAVSVMLYGSISFKFIMYSIIILGLLSTVYTMAGGIKGLIYIDTFQMLLVIGTGVVALLLIYFTMNDTLGINDIFNTLQHGQVKDSSGAWVDGNKLQIFDTSLRMDVPYNLIGALIGCSIFKFAQFSTDHEFVQRQLTCKSVKSAGVSLVYSQILSLPVVLIFLGVGMLLYVKYVHTDPAALAQMQGDARDLFPQYICHHIPTGVRGLMIIGLLAAALSSFNSAINAMASSFVSDIYLPIRQKYGKSITTDSDQMSSSKKMVVLMGCVLTGFAIFTAFLQQESGLNLVDFATGVMCFSYAGMLGVFMCALFTKRGSTASVTAALIVGVVVVLLMQPYIFGPLTEALFGTKLSIAWTWWCPIGSAISFVVCSLGKKTATVPAEDPKPITAAAE
ncbi:MAG: sodium/solute symporter [Muribaculaceae bacterium]|nr:sodium/solute symporter [Muribaculaceae bacterium]